MSDDLPDSREAYVLNSKYRQCVLEHLAEEGRATPKDIAASADEPRPHISRALTELRERNVVELRVPEARSVGRYYGLTTNGEAIWTDIREDVRDVAWSVRDPTTDRERRLVDLATEHFDGLRMVGTSVDREFAILHVDDEVLASYTDEELERGLRALIVDHSLSAVRNSCMTCQCEVLHFAAFSVVTILTDDERVYVTFDADPTDEAQQFSAAVASLYGGAKSSSAE